MVLSQHRSEMFLRLIMNFAQKLILKDNKGIQRQGKNIQKGNNILLLLESVNDYEKSKQKKTVTKGRTYKSIEYNNHEQAVKKKAKKSNIPGHKQ